MKYFFIVLKKYADFNGRARRSEYWYFVLFNIIFSLPFEIINGLLKNTIATSIYSLALLVPGIAVSVRRMHDINKSGWWYLIPFYDIILACRNGDEGTNQYGYDPKSPEMIDEIDLIGSPE